MFFYGAYVLEILYDNELKKTPKTIKLNVSKRYVRYVFSLNKKKWGIQKRCAMPEQKQSSRIYTI